MPEPQTLLMVVHGVLLETPAPKAACLAGAWPRPAGNTQPIMNSWIADGCNCARSITALITYEPNCVAVQSFNSPNKLPIGVLAKLAIMIGSFCIVLFLKYYFKKM